MNRIILFGAPGAGKGTEAGLLIRDFNIPQISTGDIFRKNISAGTDLGKRAKSFMDAGELVPDDLVTNLVVDRLLQDDVKSGYILDGFPRTLTQARSLKAILDEKDEQIGHVIYLRCEYDLLMERLTSRRICLNCGKVYNTITMPTKEPGVCDICGGEVVQRPDDSAETAERRLMVYDKETMPLIEYYRQEGLLREVDGAGTADEVHARILPILG